MIDIYHKQSLKYIFNDLNTLNKTSIIIVTSVLRQTSVNIEGIGDRE